jgi:hypothetical protein
MSPFQHKFGEFLHTYFRKLQNVLSLAESGIKWAHKSTLTDAFGCPIACRMGQSRGKTKGMPVLGDLGCNFSTDIDVKSGRGWLDDPRTGTASSSLSAGAAWGYRHALLLHRTCILNFIVM